MTSLWYNGRNTCGLLLSSFECFLFEALRIPWDQQQLGERVWWAKFKPRGVLVRADQWRCVKKMYQTTPQCECLHVDVQQPSVLGGLNHGLWGA